MSFTQNLDIDVYIGGSHMSARPAAQSFLLGISVVNLNPMLMLSHLLFHLSYCPADHLASNIYFYWET